jgi:hypothetical protein
MGLIGVWVKQLNLMMLVDKVKLLLFFSYPTAEDTYSAPAPVGWLIFAVIHHLRTVLYLINFFVILEVENLLTLTDKEMNYVSLYFMASKLNVCFWLG